MTEDRAEEISLDLDDLTLGEAEHLEELVGCSLSKMGDASEIRMIRALATITGQRTDPSFTYEDTASMRLSEMVAALTEKKPDPTDGT